MCSRVTVGFDIGGTNMRAGVVTADGTIIDSKSIPVPTTAEELEVAIVGMVAELSDRHNIAAVGVAVAGFIDPTCEMVRYAPHLPWRDRPVRAQLSEALQLPVWLEHDANAAAWGEYRFGGAQGVDNWVFFAIGTGIGATLMIDGEIYRGAFGTAPEFGHLQVVPGGRPCACTKKGCLERYCSGTALEQTTAELLEDNPQTYSILRKLPLTGKEIMGAARSGDHIAQLAVADFAQWLGLALSIVVDVLDPRLIVIGGGVSANHDLYLDTATDVMAEKIVGAGYRPIPEVRAATLSSDAGMIGVADLARRLL